jgi:hypothetical protein
MLCSAVEYSVFDRAVAGVPEVMRRMAQEAFAAHSRLIYGTPTPPRRADSIGGRNTSLMMRV